MLKKFLSRRIQRKIDIKILYGIDPLFDELELEWLSMAGVIKYLYWIIYGKVWFCFEITIPYIIDKFRSKILWQK